MLEWQTRTGDDGGLEIRLSGDLTEKTDLSELALDTSSVLFIVDGVRHINSQGVQRLFEFIRALASRATIAASRCSPSFVHQLNMVPELAQHITVHSVIAPLECTECVAEADCLVVLDDALPRLSPRSCEVCGAKMELADLEERYFAFAASPGSGSTSD